MVNRPHLIIAILMVTFIYSANSACNSSFPYSYNSLCFSECPWNNTLITYLQNAATTCLTNCPNGTYADDSTKKCVTTCPTAPILTYYDTKYNRCVNNCSNDNLQFAALNNTCVADCPSPTYGIGLLGTCVNVCPVSTYYMVYNSIRLCVNICYPNFYADVTRTCVAATSCPSTPVAYFGDDSTGLCVTDCPASKGTFADNSTRKCVIYCPLGSFADLTNRKCVATCPSVPSYYGSNVTRNCLLECNEGEFADNSTRQCTFICPANTYGDYSTRKCVKLCPLSQNTFADPLTNLCVYVCPANYFGDENTRFCVLAINCSNNTYGDPITQLCVQQKQCSVGLFVDIDQGMCVLRCTTWGNQLTGFCEPNCLWNPPIDSYFKDPSTKICVKTCPISPRTFGDPLTRQCQAKCSTGYFADPSTLLCVAQCPQAYFANSLIQQCVSNCTQNSTDILFFQKISSTCVANCPLNYFADNSTLSCVLTCLNNTYGFVPTRQCVSSCPVGWFGDSYTTQCVQSCPMQNGQYADPSTNLCVSTCPTNPDLYGQDLNDANLTCVTQCTIPGFFADPLTRVCVYICNSTAGYYGDNSDRRCYSRCPTGYGNPLNAQCIGVCPRIPKFFYGDNLTGLCVLSCPNQTYGDPNNNLCVTAKNCSGGLFGDDVTGWCVPVCSELLNLYADITQNKCVDVCTFPYYADPITQKCTLACSANTYKDNSTSQCVRMCNTLPVLFGDPNSGYCQYNCTSNWFAYSSSTQRICVAMCPSNPPMLADLQNFKCVSACANNTFAFINNSFRGCLDYCPPQVYNSSLQVDLYADNTTWQCVVVCPYGFYSFLHPTNSTVRLCVRYCPMVGTTYYYAEDTLRECVTTCPLLYGFTYGDKIDFKCASVCSRNQYKDNSTSTCVYRCPNGTYANNVTWNCSAWCNEGYYAQNINNTCVKSCPTNLYGYNKVCITQCPNNTVEYKDNTTWLCVSRCPAYPNYFADNSSVACVLQCPVNYYADVGTRTCVLPINCTQPTIADPVSRQCVLQCPKNPMYYLTIELNLCGTSCSNGTFAYNQTNLCVDECPQPYFGVNTSAPFYCTQYCPTLQYMWVNVTTRMCVPFCPPLLFRDNLTMKCVEICPDYSYANSSNNLCVTSCAPLYADDFTKSCVQICPNGTTASNNSYKCQQYCNYGEYMFNKVCYTGCPANLYADNLTRACLSSCPYDPLTYADPLNHKCVINCTATQYAFISNLTCATVCPLGYYKELTLLLCLQVCLQDFYSDNSSQSCIASCNQSAAYPYADPTSQACVAKCPSDPDLYGLNNKCLTQCDLGYFAQNITRTCVSICPNVSTTYPNASWADDLTRRCLKKCSSLSYAFTNISHNVCLNVCPTGFYASIADQACVPQCPPGTFAYNSTTTCVDQCPSGQWADLVKRICMPNCTYNSSLYADDSSTSCVQVCPAYPDLFADDTTQKCVLSCPNNSYAYNVTRRCVTNCPSPYFADPYQLLCALDCLIPEIAYADSVLRKCVSGCANHTINVTIQVPTLVQVNRTVEVNITVNTTNSTNTTTNTTNTTNTTVLANVTQLVNVTVQVNTIVQRDTLFYSDNSTLKCVQQCPQFPNRLYGQNVSRTCMQSCPSGTYGDNDTRVCLDTCVFQSPKFTWKDAQNNFCTTLCPYGLFADNYTGSCELQCTNGTFADQSSRRCVINCPINPASYSTIVAGLGVCVYNCPNGTYSSEVTISCVSTCPTSPFVYYTYPPTNACVRECIFPYYADGDLQACTMNCKVGFYGNKTLKSCQACQVQCVTCTGYLVCTSCIQGFYLYQITCVVSCPTYPVLYYAHKQSSVCYLNCPVPFFGESSNGLCQQTCPALKYANSFTRTCTACPQGCQLCNSIGCSSCLTGYTFLPSAAACNKNCNSTAKFYFLDKCYTTCPAGSYLTYDLVHCSACSSPCATCVGVAGNCTSCIQSYFYIGQCLNACPSNFYIDDKLNCISCSVNPQKCVLPPLTYKITTFKGGFDLKAHCVFNRAVNLTLERFKVIVQIQFNGVVLKSSQYSATVFNTTTFMIIFPSYITSLNQNSLSFSFSPGSISDQYGNVLTTVTVSQNVTIVTGVNPQVMTASKSVQGVAVFFVISILVLIALLLIKNNYAGLIAIQYLQLMHLHIFLYWNPLPYLQYKFLDILKYFNLMFIPSPFSPLNLTNSYYSIFTDDISFLSNCPIVLFMAIVIFIYLLVSILSSKKLISNKHVRKLFKRVRKHRVKYGLILDACWIVYPYAIVISLLQFKLGKFGTTMQTLNIGLSALTFVVLNAVVLYVLFVAYKYRKSADKIPKKFAFIQLQPSQNTLQMPVRYLRKFVFGLALLLPSFQSQLVGLLAINLSFLCMYLCYRPSKIPLNNYICIFTEILMVVFEGVFYSYDKLDVKSTNNQYSFSIAMIFVQSMVLLGIMAWVVYRLILVIRDAETWKIIYQRLTRNTDPEFLKEQQRKRDLEFDFGGLQVQSQDQRTDHAFQKLSVKRSTPTPNQKFNIFDQADRDQQSQRDLEKPFRINESIKRPSSMESSEKLALKSQSSDARGLFQPNKSANNYRKRNHLQIRHRQQQNSVDDVLIEGGNESMVQISNKKQTKGGKQKVLWEDIQFDDQQI